MPVWVFQHILQNDNGLPEDSYVTNWHFYTASQATTPDCDNVRDMLKDFFNVQGTSTATLCSYLTDDLNPVTKIKGYNLDDSKPRAPRYEGTYTLGTMAGGYSMPYETAICLSFEAARASGVPQARRRNRVYLGPWGPGVVFTAGRPHPTFLDNIKLAAGRLKAAADASVTWDWVVFSPTSNTHLPIAHLWVDDAYDTQRRRGINPSTRKQLYF